MTDRKEFTFDRVVRLVIGVVVVLALLFLIHLLKNVLLPFLVACLIAYMFEPFVQYNRRLLHLRGRVIAVFVTLFESLFLLGISFYFIGPMVADEINATSAIMQRYAATELNGGFLPDEVHQFIRHTVDFETLSKTMTQEEWIKMAERILDTSWNIISGGWSILMGIFNWCIVILYVIFIMIDYEKLNRAFRNMVPPRYRHTAFTIGRDIKTSMNHYFRGQALIALLVGILFSIGFSIIGMPMAIVFGLFIGLLNLVPYLQLISLIPAVFLCIVYSASGESDFWSIFSQCMIVYCVVQSIQDLFLTPKIMGKAMNLNPAIILLSLSVWGTLLGFIGLIIALPLTTLILSYYERYITSGPNARRKWRRKESEEIREVMETPPDGEF